MRFAPNLIAASLAPVLANGVIIGLELAYLAAIPGDTASVLAVMAWIGAGECLSVTVLGTAVFRFLMRNEVIRRYIREMK